MPVAEARRRRRCRHHPRRRPTGACAAGCTFGCCVGNVCRTGNSTQLCGTGGRSCVTCGAGTVCSGGTCVVSPPGTCGASYCSTGCCQGKTCQPGTSENACGTGGVGCVRCAGGQVCSAGTCVPSPPGTCTPSNCPTGCCDGNTCRAGTANNFCGLGGLACVNCSGSTPNCVNHV